jgi:hypothetical protein
MSNNHAFFHPFPVASVNVHVGAADASSLKFNKYFSARDFGFWGFFNFNVVGSSVNSCFQKVSLPVNPSCNREY